MKKIAVFASGSGSNAEAIYEYFKNDAVKIEIVVCNKENAGVLDRATRWGCDQLVIDRAVFQSETLVEELKSREIDLIVLAGFLWLIPTTLLNEFPNQIVNIHPALLPKYGGKGMHGMNVHRAVFANKEKESGITIHYINQEYDKGASIFQTTCDVEGLLPEEIAAEVLKLEHYHFPRVIEQLLLDE